MKKIIYLLVTSFAIMAFVACHARQQDTTAPPEYGQEQEMKEVEVAGKIYVVPEKPQRIVADYYVGELLYLEAPLVGADLTWPSNAWLQYTKALTDVGQSIERVASLAPDLIITMQEEQVQHFSALAPTVYIPWGAYDPEQLMAVLGKIVDREAAAQNWQVHFDEQIAQLQKVMPDPTVYTLSIVDVFGTDLYLYGQHFSRAGHILYGRLGFKGPAEAERTFIRKAGSWLLLTPEMMPNHIGDYLLFLNEDGTPDSNLDVTKRYTDNVIWESLPAVQNNRVFYLKSGDFMHEDPYSLDLQITQLMEIFNDGK